MIRSFIYKFNKGPLSKNKLKAEKFKEGNCRRAIQYYFFKKHNLYLTPKQVLNPQGYKETGKFIVKENKFTRTSIKKLKEGDIIYSERLKNKNGERIHKNKEIFRSKNDWIISLHSVIYLGKNKIYQSSPISGGTSTWSMKEFLKFYKPVAAKRLVGEK